MKILNIAAVGLVVGLLQACSGTEAPEAQPQEQEVANDNPGQEAPDRPRAQVIQVPDDDQTMEEAMKLGQKTLPAFAERLANPASDEDSFSIKFNLDPSGDTEFIWASNLKKTATGFTGVLDNEPLSPKFEAGQSVEIPEGDVIDWAYTKGGVMQGHFTTRVLINDMPNEEGDQYRQMFGW